MAINDILTEEKATGLEIERLCMSDIEAAQAMVQEIALEALALDNTGRAQSAAYARLICRFLLHKKCKSRLAQLLTENETLTTAVFGKLNTYKYSIIFLLKRILRLNNTALTQRVLELIKENPFEDSEAKPWSDRFSLGFIITQALEAPEDYLNLSEENRAVIDSFLNNNGSSQ
ncbi:MAG: hypothetical protein IJC37_06030 [Clostridia bacterium]|nr:hypothetical protein [Clostridia bacterium]